MKKKLITLTLLAISIISFAGCGSTKGSSNSSSNAKTIEVALVAENAPYTYADKNGNPKGYDYEVLQKVAAGLKNYKFDYKVIDYQTGLIGTKEGKYDINAGCYFRTDAREKSYLVSDPYNYYFMNLIVNSNSKINSLTDMNGKSLVPIDATDGRYASFKDWEKAHPNVKIKMTPSSSQQTYVDMADSVHKGTYDAAYLSKAQFDGISDKLGYKMKVTDIVDGRDTVYLINKQDTELQKEINEQLSKLQKDGTLSALSKKYFNQNNFDIAKKLGLR